MDRIKIIHIDKTDSTNRWMHDYRGEEGGQMTVVTAEHQSAGRGQGNNRWESEAGLNLLFSVRTYPSGVPAARQYVMLEAEALAVRDALALHTDGITIKWPNDIYHNNRKIGGTLSECAVSAGMIKSCVIGTGINVNQLRFTSDAPNPVSLRQITGRETDRRELLDTILERFSTYLEMVNSGRYDEIAHLYRQSLYRRDGLHRYRDGNGEFTAFIEDITPEGHLLLRRADGSTSRYAFKEVSFIINE